MRPHRPWTKRVVFTTIVAASLAVAAVVYALRESPGGGRGSFFVGEDLQIHKLRRVIRERIDAGEYPPSLEGILGARDDYGSEIEIIVSEWSIKLRSPGRDRVPETIDDWVAVVLRYPLR